MKGTYDGSICDGNHSGRLKVQKRAATSQPIQGREKPSVPNLQFHLQKLFEKRKKNHLQRQQIVSINIQHGSGGTEGKKGPCLHIQMLSMFSPY